MPLTESLELSHGQPGSILEDKSNTKKKKKKKQVGG